MADTIVDFGGNAKITAAAWAKDKTLQDILTGNSQRNQLLKLLAQSAKVEKDEIAKALGDVADKVTQAGESDAKGDHDKTQALEKNTRTVYEYQQTLGNITRTIAGVANTADTKSAFGLVTGWLDSLGNNLGQINPQFVYMFGALSSIVSVASSFYHRLEELNKSTKDLYSTGLVFNGGMRGIVAAASDAGMSVGDLSKILTKFSAVGVTVGINRLTKLNSMFLQQTNLGANLMMSQEEASEALLETMEMMRSSGRLVGMTDEQVVKSGTDMLKSFNSLAEETGRNRDEIRKATNDLIKRPDIDTVLRSLDAESSKKLNETFTQVAAKMGQAAGPVADAIAKINLGGLGAVDENMRTAMNVIPGLTSAFEDAAKGVPGAVDRMVNIMDSPDTRQRMRALSVQLPDVAKTLQELSAGSRQAAEAQARLNAMSPAERAAHDAALKEQQRQQAVQNSVNASFKRFGNAFDKLALGFSNTLLPVVDTLATVFEYLGKALGGVGSLADMGGGTGGIVMSAVAVLGSGLFIAGSLRFLRKLVSGGPFKSLLGGLMKPGALPGLGGAGGGAARSGAGITGGLKNMVGNVSEMIGGVFKTLTGILKDGADAIGSAIASLGKGIGSALGDLGVGLGKAVEGIVGGLGKAIGTTLGAILQGLAVGLKAFASPQVLIGAGILSLSILMIGASVAGASWMLGKALPTFAEGLKSFGDIDGSNLIKVGLGAVALGVGLAAMAVGEVVNKVGGLVSGLLGFFQEDPATKIKRFVGYFQLLADGKDAVEAGSAVAERLGQINIGSSLGPTINALSEAFSSKYFSKDLGDVKEDYINKFFNIIGIIGKAGTDIDPGLGVLNQISKINIGSNLGETIKNLADSFSKKYLSADVSDINTEMINKLFDVFAVFGQGLDSVQLGLDTMKLLANTKDIVKNMSGGISSLANIGSILPRNLNTASIIMQIDSIMMIFERFAKNNTIIEQAVNSINTLGTVNVAGLTTLQNLFTGSNQNLGGNAAIGGPPGIAITGLDKATSDYYEKTVMQFNRMIELLEVAHADAIDIKRIETDGLKDITDAVKASSGRIF
jgi:hypothetical protein